jgi:hypothetical protein
MVMLIGVALRVVTIEDSFKSGVFLNSNSSHLRLAGALE